MNATQRVRAVIYQDKKVLLLKRIKPEGTFWVFPGGAIEPHESPTEAVQRECLEELGVQVEVGDLFMERVSNKPQTRGQKELYYLGTVVGGELGTGRGPEYQPNSHYIGHHEPEWVASSMLGQLDVKPRKVRDAVIQRLESTT